MDPITSTNHSSRITRSAYMWTNVLSTPFWAIFNMLPFILYKDLHATPLQVTAIITLKPLVSLLSMYWIAFINKRPDRLLSNLIWARLLGHLPFFLFPFIDNVWYFVLSFGFYMMLARGVVPAWMEVLKLNIPHLSREKVFAYGSLFGYLGNALLPVLLGWLLDGYHQAWRWIFPGLAVVSMGAAFFKNRIPIPKADLFPEAETQKETSFKDVLFLPWKNAWELIRQRPDFLRFQLGFMLGGAGVMIMQPALPEFFVDVLKLSYVEMAFALAVCKGIGFALTSQAWAQYMPKVDIFRFSALPPLCLCVFSMFLLAAPYHIGWLYAAYVCYGVMQAGSEMCWHLSGPIFARHEDSSVYSSVNVLTVGLRGAIVPPLGSVLVYGFQASSVIVIGGVLCILSYIRLSYDSKKLAAGISNAEEAP